MCMYEFAVGFAIGIVVGKIRHRKTYDVAVQATPAPLFEEPTHPIWVPRRFVRGQLNNFWGD
jgi:hypothetical protein